MNRTILGAAVGTTALVAALAATTSSTATAAGSGTTHRSAHVCAAAPVGYAACHAQVVIDASGKPAVTATPSGYGPADIQSAYKLPASAGAGTTVAIVDAYNDPTADSDLAVYRSQYGLAPCTLASGCLRITNQTGGSKLPRTNAGWATEISLDLDMVSAACPACKILLVEATSNSFANLGAAVNYAATQGVAAISNSYGGGDSAPNSDYNHPGIAITASSGDAGYGVESPASFYGVIGVGGTSLRKASNTRGWTETAWSGAGSGCSTLNPHPAWQVGTSCTGKAVADVSAVADPNTGVAVYDSTRYQGRSGWQVYGGTSASSPIIASVYAMGGNLSGYPAAHTWATPSGLFDVTSGSNGSCPTTIWCTAGTGWDGPTGLGTPNGTTSF
ncbi:MAG: S53 family peptidase [Pseudonocardiales bacterium]